jgi:protease-4
VGLAVFVSSVGVFLLYLAATRGPEVQERSTLVLRPGGDLPEMLPDDLVTQFAGREGMTVRGVVESLRMAKRDPRIASVLLLPSTLELPYWAKVQELRDAVLDFKESGKTVVAFLEFGGDREYYLASAADRVFLLPASPLDLTGLASYEIFLRGTLDKIGAYPDFVHIGDYKTAPNQFTETGFTPAHREMAEALNRDMYEQLVRGIANARRKSETEVRELIDRGPFLPTEARQAGLIDGIAYLDEIDDHVAEIQLAGDAGHIEASDYQRTPPSAVGIRPRSRIAVLYAVGTITSGESRFDPVNGPIVGSETMVEEIRKVREDESIKAIVLRVDSPGGSSIASDVIWRELTITREQNPARPLVVSMSDLAASGGYYIALPGQVIVAQPATLTGSIGIFGGKLVIAGAMEKVGARAETVQSGTNATIYSPFTPFSPPQRARIGEYMEDFYDTFVARVAASRRRTLDQIQTVAQGRVWTGQQARDRGLVDELGGLDLAVAIAKQRASIPEDEDVEIVVYPARRSLYDALSERFGRSNLGSWGVLTGAAGRSAMAALAAPALLFRRGEPLALMPFAFVR